MLLLTLIVQPVPSTDQTQVMFVIRAKGPGKKTKSFCVLCIACWIKLRGEDKAKTTLLFIQGLKESFYV